MYLICKITRTDYTAKHGIFADVTPIAFAYDADTAAKLADEVGGLTVVLDTNFRIALDAAIYRSKQVA